MRETQPCELTSDQQVGQSWPLGIQALWEVTTCLLHSRFTQPAPEPISVICFSTEYTPLLGIDLADHEVSILNNIIQT